ncbi:MAG: DUF2306 domain-containing protein [Bacteroidetes bacterium]|nr:MAG: DUF2306 domain-containing protein [Bacteroidota bacterium]
MVIKQRLFVSLFLLALLAFFSLLLLQITLQYIPYNTDVGFLRIKQQYIHIDHWRAAFFIHVYASMWVLLAGFTQFSAGIRRQMPQVHRVMGYIYLLDILFITGPASLVMSFYANGGLSSRIAFATLALLWLFSTAQAWRYARARKWRLHQDWMIRSFALTLSALTLRAWKLGIIWALAPPPMDVYRVVAWLGWVPNLLLAEYLIRRGWRRRGTLVL